MTTNLNQEEVPAFRLTKAKRDSLSLLAEYFCLRTNDVALLLRGHEPNENDKRSVRHTLGLLYRAGLAYRIPYIEYEREHGSSTYVYGLNDQGVKYCASIFPYAKGFDEHSHRTLDHELEISWFHIALKNFARKHKLTLYWQQSDLKCTISPDAMFALTDPSRPEGKNTLYYFLEIERAKIGHYVDGKPSIINKLQKYYNYYNSDVCQKEWNFRQFRVIVVQRNEERSTNLLKRLNKEYNHRMFWLTTESAYKHDIGNQIFLTPKDFDKAAYSFLDI